MSVITWVCDFSRAFSLLFGAIKVAHPIEWIVSLQSARREVKRGAEPTFIAPLSLRSLRLCGGS